MLIMGITITLTGDWHSGQLAALSPIMLRNSLLTEGKILLKQGALFDAKCMWRITGG